MATANIVKVWHNGIDAFIAARVNEGGTNVEYTASVSLEELNKLSTNAEKKAALVAALKAERDSRITSLTDIAGITGTATI